MKTKRTIGWLLAVIFGTLFIRGLIYVAGFWPVVIAFTGAIILVLILWLIMWLLISEN